MPNFMHQGAHERFGFNDLMTLGGAHPEHDRRWRSPARVIGIEEPVQFAPSVAGPDAANFHAYWRSAEQTANLGGERASTCGGGREVASLERWHQRIHRLAR